ncbi:AAA family ATPase [Streptomyces gilvosporeus]|uniref:AAA family ATPase n=1 Tax=Streptomyces gilvosporeus TaxID=553510 RepID=UPI00234318D5|nr:AAA family ATPase [Streptomyces gilvosporeus]
MDDAVGPAGATEPEQSADPCAEPVFRPRGLVDFRAPGADEGPGDVPPVLSYPAGTVVVVSGLPGSGKSTLLRRWSEAALVIDPRVVHVACEAVMPAWLPYAVYRPWARWRYFRWLRAAVDGGRPVLVHDCGGRPWMRRWLAGRAGRQGRELHLVLLDVGVAEALSGQETRGRRASRRAFARHRRGLDRLLSALPARGPRGGTQPVPDLVREAASVVLLDRGSRERVAAVRFDAASPEGAA